MDKIYDITDYIRDKEELISKIEHADEEIEIQREKKERYITELENLTNRFLFSDKVQIKVVE